MAKVNHNVGRLPIEDFIARNDGVVHELDNRTFEIAVRAEALLAEHREDGHASIDIERGKYDRYVVLSDERGQNAALSIEYGRAAGEKEVRGDDGEMTTVSWGASPGLFILATASNLPKKRKGKVHLD
ncbi:tail completion or Neck1 protein [Streptomyces phage Endor2]|uniref:Head-to-tail connector protein n=1 Tax=Streptomyces phage Endor2 TaxID=2740182 RepID=A0A7G4AX18_9CAUD|nr:tail completion or Neck1 protein [Streptomyces phage Endor2]QMP84558.1 head-to-tail connector protein [Streptomyces phage Endor2]